METIEYVIGERKCVARRITEEEVNLETLVTETFSQGVVRRSCPTNRNLFGMGAASVCIGGSGEEFWSINAPKIMLNCPFASENGVAWPKFVKNPGTDMLSVPWMPPDGMRLVFGVQVVENEMGIYAGKCWLIAYDAHGAAFRLPMGNLFEDCTVCMGDYKTKWRDAMGCIDASVTQLLKGPANSDLLGSERQQNVKAMFSFTPKDEGFIQNPPTKPWPSLCEKIGGAAMNSWFQPVKP